MDVHFDMILAKNLINKASLYETAAFVKQKMARIHDIHHISRKKSDFVWLDEHDKLGD